jgi:hypothetical protein
MTTTYLQDFGNPERPVHFLNVLVKDIWKTGFRSSLSQKLKVYLINPIFIHSELKSNKKLAPVMKIN